MGSYLLLVGVILLSGVITGAGVVIGMAVAILCPPRMSDGKALWLLRRLSPEDLGLTFEEKRFRVRDQRTGRPINLSAWWIPHRNEETSTGSEHTAILLHGYADAKVGAIAWAPLWHSLGFNLLVIDQRAHGESEGHYCTAGFFERHDLSEVIDAMLAEHANHFRRLMLVGISLGASTALATAALRDDITAVVLESPPADFRSTAIAQMNQVGAPGQPFQSLALRVAERLAACDFDAVRPIDLLGQVKCPVMIIAPQTDPLVNDADRVRMQRALEFRLRPGEDAWWSVDSGHLTALHAQPVEYERRLRDFIARLSKAGDLATNRSGSLARYAGRGLG